jgi:hypothetical protein
MARLSSVIPLGRIMPDLPWKSDAGEGPSPGDVSVSGAVRGRPLFGPGGATFDPVVGTDFEELR